MNDPVPESLLIPKSSDSLRHDQCVLPDLLSTISTS
jgi:hypothetical protein